MASRRRSAPNGPIGGGVCRQRRSMAATDATLRMFKMCQQGPPSRHWSACSSEPPAADSRADYGTRQPVCGADQCRPHWTAAAAAADAKSKSCKIGCRNKRSARFEFVRSGRSARLALVWSARATLTVLFCRLPAALPRATIGGAWAARDEMDGKLYAKMVALRQFWAFSSASLSLPNRSPLSLSLTPQRRPQFKTKARSSA